MPLHDPLSICGLLLIENKTGMEKFPSEEIGSRLRTRAFGRKLFFYKELDGSSQDLAKELLKKGAEEGTTIITEIQQARGRMGRKFYCIEGAGIYLSIILKPKLKPPLLLQIPLVAGVAAAKAIRRATGLEVRLKWVNDLILNGKKVGGILVEIIPEGVILGIGINVNRPAGFIFPENLEQKAAFLSDYSHPISREGLFCLLLEELEKTYQELLSLGFEPIRREWKKLSLTIGNEVMVEGEVGLAEDIDEEGALILRLGNGSQKKIISPEISIRTPEGKYI